MKTKRTKPMRLDVDAELHQRMRIYCAFEDVSQRLVIERALRRFLYMESRTSEMCGRKEWSR